MKSFVGSIILLSPAVWAAPALVWKNGSTDAIHHSKDITMRSLLEDAAEGVSGKKVVFLVGRNKNGTEGLTALTSSGQLPTVASKSREAHCVHHHVSGVQNAAKVTQTAKNVGVSVQISLDEFSAKPEPVAVEVAPNGGLLSKSAHSANKKARAINNAEVLVVEVPADVDAAALDQAVHGAIVEESIGSVVLTAVRSVDEVKHERDMAVHQRRLIQEEEGRRILASQGQRRLADADNGDNDNDNSGVYYVSMTPNILSGLLFFLLFSLTTYTGVTCMGMIAGQDTYVSKMPSVGREA